jgi:amino acid adenylation domain-containing protein
VPAAWELDGPLDGTALQAALRLVLGRHQVLAGGWVGIAAVDLAGLGAREQRAEVARATRRPFGAAASDPLSASRLQLGPERQVLVLAADPGVADGASLAVLAAELAVAYDALAGGTEPRLPAAPLGKRGSAAGDTSPAATLAALIALLARYSGDRELALAIADDGRPAGCAACVGAFERDLLLNADLSGDPSFAEIARRAAYARAGAEPAAAGALPSVRFDDRPARPAPRGSRLTWTPLPLDPDAGRYDLTVRLREGGALAATCRAGARDPAAADRLLGHLRTVVRAGRADPARRLSDLPLLTAPERRQIVVDWNRTSDTEPPAACLHELVERQARATPDATAVVAADDRLTYRQLDERANRIAQRLRSLGVGPDQVVAVQALREARTVTAFLGVLKAGGAYLPLDPETPPARLRYILGDARAHTALLDGTGDASGPLPASVPAPAAHQDNLAYLIYTSGTTGRPKAVAVPHRQIVHSTAARQAGGRASPGAYAVPVPLSFDASAAGIWWSLCSGGRVVLPTEDEVRDPARLARLVRLEQVTHLTHMPAYYALLLSAGGRALRTLRDVAVGGDVMPAALVRDHYRLLPWAVLYNDYGPTEATIWATAFRCRPAHDAATVPIGRPIARARVYLLDRYGNPAPVGVAGEIHIGGSGVVRGYHGDPRLTAERFVPDPFAESPGARMYRTGDLGRFGASGDIDFLGRTDSQVKVRGYRVELGEIEAVIQRHPAVAAAVVSASDGPPGETELTAYVVPAGGESGVDDLADWLPDHLPTYMRPAHVILLDRLPQTRYGKTDRSALARGERG